MLHGSFSTGEFERGHPEHVWKCIKSIWDGLKYGLNIFHTILACIHQLWKYIGLVPQNYGKTPFQLVFYHHVPYWNDKCLGWFEMSRMDWTYIYIYPTILTCWLVSYIIIHLGRFDKSSICSSAWFTIFSCLMVSTLKKVLVMGNHHPKYGWT